MLGIGLAAELLTALEVVVRSVFVTNLDAADKLVRARLSAIIVETTPPITNREVTTTDSVDNDFFFFVIFLLRCLIVHNDCNGRFVLIPDADT
mmetsp:Transcript_18764/g.23626  ORF Transcript_18764/g.23626 Transcript_18764/m.23626 type:complete len:93 (-) Transcript_18764:48-326(-)